MKICMGEIRFVVIYALDWLNEIWGFKVHHGCVKNLGFAQNLMCLLTASMHRQAIDATVVAIAFCDCSRRVLGFCEGKAKSYTW